MASYLPPTEDLPIFDNQVFSQNEEALTYKEAEKYFVTFPSSQGPTTITDLIAGEIEYSSPASGSFFNIGTNQVSGGHIHLGPTGGSTGVSVCAGNFDFKNNTVNNATALNTGGMSICDAQTSGILNIATNAGRSGDLNINNTEGADNAINIGASGTTTTQKGLVNSGTNVYYDSTTSSENLTEYINGGLSVLIHNQAGDFNLNMRLNKVLNIVIAGNNIQTLTLPANPVIGQLMNIRCGKHGGTITLTSFATRLLYSSNESLVSSNGQQTIILQNIGTSQWCYYDNQKWAQMNDALNPLADTDLLSTALTIGSTVVNGNIVIGASLGQGDISIASAQASGGTVTIGSTNTVTTFAGGLTLGSSKYITTSHTGTISLPSTTQVGGVVTGSSISTTVPSTGNLSSMSSISLTAGVWLVSGSRQLDSTSGTTRVVVGLGNNLRTNVTGITNDFLYGIASSGINTTGSTFYEVNGIVSLTGTATVYYNMVISYTSAPTAGTGSAIFKAVRIA
jgi:hypothetical protein